MQETARVSIKSLQPHFFFVINMVASLVCKTVFKSFTLRKEYAKHHCRTCGRVVCHACSSNKILSEVSGKPERICTECLVSGSKAEGIAKQKQREQIMEATGASFNKMLTVDSDSDEE